jgi:hypothetical protein
LLLAFKESFFLSTSNRLLNKCLKCLKRLEVLLEQAESADAEEDARYGRDRRGDELPAELARRETRLKRIREAKRALEERAREQAKSKGEAEEKAKPKGKMQYNFTDPEARIMPGADGFVQAYNAQMRWNPISS